MKLEREGRAPTLALSLALTLALALAPAPTYLKAKAVLSCMSESTLSPAICAAASIAVRSWSGYGVRVSAHTPEGES